MTLVASKNYIYAYEIDPGIGFISNYTINLTDTLNSTILSIYTSAIINNYLILLTTNR